MMRTSLFGASLLAGAMLVSGSLTASEIDLGNRVGKVLAAEMTQAPIKVYDLEKTPSEVNFADRRFIVVTVSLVQHRSISVVDYKLNVNGTEFPCIALSRNDESFVFNSQVMFATGKDQIKLLYIADGATLGQVGERFDATLETALPGRKSSVTVPVTNLGEKAPTPAAEIPAEGNF